MSNIVPPISARGLFELKQPFLALPDKEYWVGAIRTFDEIRSRNLDIMDLVYSKVGLDQTVAEADYRAAAKIITLLSLDADPIYVPSTYIVRYPNQALIPYSRIVLTANLGPLADSYDTALLEQVVKEAISGYIGVEPEIALGRLAHTGVVSPEQHRQLEEARLNNVRFMSTSYADKLAAEELNRQLRERIEMLENILLAEGLIEVQTP